MTRSAQYNWSKLAWHLSYADMRLVDPKTKE